FLVVLPVLAQVAPPPKLEPVPEPPPPVGLDGEPAEPGPVVRPGARVESFTTPNGTQVITVTEPNGWQYQLVEQHPAAPFAPRTRNSDLDAARVPMGTILQC